MSGNRRPINSSTYRFGSFRLLPDRLQLFNGEKRVRIGSRAIGILTLLVKRTGEVVSSREIMNQVWPDALVVEGTVRVHVAALRKALGDAQSGVRYIINEPGRGYRFVEPVEEEYAPPPVDDGSRSKPLALPTRLIGRHVEISEIIEILSRRRLLTIVGPGGIGKTSLATAIARQLADSFPDGAHFVDLTAAADPHHAISALASTLRLAVPKEAGIEDLVGQIRHKQMLIVLDNCERVIGATARLSEILRSGAPDIRILATSREPLRARDEVLYHVAPLRAPRAGLELTSSDAMTFPAVQLFVERIGAEVSSFTLTDENASIVAEICRKLDGLPLALELASAGVAAYGLSGLLFLPEDRLAMLSQGHRTTDRHRTLRAVLDWSYETLELRDRVVLERLSIFRRRFTLEEAIAVGLSEGIGRSDVVEAVGSLAAKSLLCVDVSGPMASYGLLETTRAYALEKLHAAGEADATAIRLAGHVLDLLRTAEQRRREQPRARWRDRYREAVDDIRCPRRVSARAAGGGVCDTATAIGTSGQC